jgi:hypothetical protein
MTCADIVLAESSYTGDTGVVVLGIADTVTPVVSGTAVVELSCDEPSSHPVTPGTGSLSIDLEPQDGGSLFNFSPCRDVRFDLVDSCGRSVSVEVAMTYDSESSQQTLTCPTEPDAGPDGVAANDGG